MPGSNYWSALREHADLIIVDSPAPDRSRAGLTIAPAMDQTLLVVSAEQADVRAPAQLRDALAVSGGHVAGVFFNRQTVEAPGFLKALLP
jgi:Mrp family chromosome partitioning ATPase